MCSFSPTYNKYLQLRLVPDFKIVMALIKLLFSNHIHRDGTKITLINNRRVLATAFV